MRTKKFQGLLKNGKPLRKIYTAMLVFVLICCSCLIVLSSINIFILNRSSDKIADISGLDRSKDYDCILVLGAGIISNSRPSDMLRDRLDVSISLYNMGYSDTLLLSGDCSGEDYDEVNVMKNYCLAAGVPEDSIICDNKGYSTLESVYNTKEYGFENIIVVTQRYHLSRAIYIADQMGVESMGISSTTRGYRGQIIRDVREGLARAKDFFVVSFYR